MSRQRIQQQGLIGILLLVTIAVVAVAVFSKNIWGEDSKTYQAKVNREALAQAKAALLEYVEVGSQGQLSGALGTNTAGTSAVILGRLPCPNQDGNGVSVTPCGTTTYNTAGIHSLGLFPWSTLNTPVPRDASHQCLWYAVDGAFKINPTTSPLNSDSFGSFSVIQPVKPTDPSLLNTAWPTQLLAGNLSNSAANSSPDRVVAVIMASGSAGGTQTQTSVGGTTYTCGLTRALSGVPNAETSAPDFLKYYSSTINNQSLLPAAGGAPVANVANPALTPKDALKTFITADIGQEQLNDQIVWITAEEFSRAATKRVAGILANFINTNYIAFTGNYPPASTTPGGPCSTTTPKLLQGFIPGTCGGRQIIPITPNRLDPSNDIDLWLGQAHYAVSQHCISGGTITHPCASGTKRVKIDGRTAPAILLMRGRALGGQTACMYTGSVNFNSVANNTIVNCLEGTNRTVVTAAITAAAGTGSYVTDISTIQYSAPNPSSSNDYMFQFTLQ